jgi:hypothetical protein
VATAHDPFSPRRAYVLGILGGLLFWLKQNDIGIPLAIATYFSLGLLLTRTRRTYAVALAMLAAGVVTVTGLVLLPFALQGGLGALWDAAFLFNFLYVDTPPFQRLIALAYVPVVLPGLGLTLLAGVGWLIGAGTFVNAARQGGDVVRRWSDARVRLVPNRAKEVSGRLDETQIERLLSIALIAAPIELVLVTLAPTLFDHYHLSLLPIFSVLAAFAFCLGLAALQGEQRWRRASVVIVGVMVIALAVSSLPRATELMRRLRGRAGNLPHIIEFISQHSAPGDPIFIWGGESRVVFQTGSIVPTRFIYSAPIIRDRYADAGKIGELLEALEQRPPKLIFDSHPTEFFFEPQPHHSDLPFFEFRVSNAQTEERVNRLLARYVQRETIAGWEVYERLGP